MSSVVVEIFRLVGDETGAEEWWWWSVVMKLEFDELENGSFCVCWWEREEAEEGVGEKRVEDRSVVLVMVVLVDWRWLMVGLNEVEVVEVLVFLISGWSSISVVVDVIGMVVVVELINDDW